MQSVNFPETKWLVFVKNMGHKYDFPSVVLVNAPSDYAAISEVEKLAAANILKPVGIRGNITIGAVYRLDVEVINDDED